jgi:hypothetical protein
MSVKDTVSRLVNHLILRNKGYLILTMKCCGFCDMEGGSNGHDVSDLGMLKKACDDSEVVITDDNKEVIGIVKAVLISSDRKIRVAFKFKKEYRILRATVLDDAQALKAEEFHFDRLMEKQNAKQEKQESDVWSGK